MKNEEIMMNNVNSYQQEAIKTAIYPKDMAIIYPLIGLSGEVGEVAEKIKKVIRDKNSDFDFNDRTEIAKELGDVMWYIANLANDLGYNLEEILYLNVEKIKSRSERNVIHGNGDNR